MYLFCVLCFWYTTPWCFGCVWSDFASAFYSNLYICLEAVPCLGFLCIIIFLEVFFGFMIYSCLLCMFLYCMTICACLPIIIWYLLTFKCFCIHFFTFWYTFVFFIPFYKYYTVLIRFTHVFSMFFYISYISCTFYKCAHIFAYFCTRSHIWIYVWMFVQFFCCSAQHTFVHRSNLYCNHVLNISETRLCLFLVIFEIFALLYTFHIGLHPFS